MIKPSHQTVEITLTAVFTTIVSGVGSGTFKYQWYHNGTIINGENGERLIITDVTESKTGKYECVVTNCCDDTDKSEATLMMSSE